MFETLQPVLPKTPVLDLCCHIGRSGLCIGDPASLQLTETGDIVLSARVRRRRFGVIPCQVQAPLGHLGPRVARILRPAIEHRALLRVRIVNLTPEHLCGPQGPEVFVSVWADPQVLRHLPQRTSQ